MADTNDITPTPNEQGNAQIVQKDGESDSDFAKRLQKQSAILGKVVNQSNSFARELSELKEMVASLSAKKTDDVEEPEKKKRKSPSDNDQTLSFQQMQERLKILEEKETKKIEAAKKNLIGRALERNGVDASISNKVTKMLLADLGDKVVVDDSADDLTLSIKYNEETVPAEKYLEMWMASDEGSIFRSQKTSPTPKLKGTTAKVTESKEGLSSIDFSKEVARIYASGMSRSEIESKIKSLKMKSD